MTDSIVPTPEDDPERRIESIAEDFLAGLQAEERPNVAAVLAAHPDIAEPLKRRLALVERLFRAGQNAKAAGRDGHPFPADQAHRLKCPHCGNRIQLVEPRQKEVTCLNCGSSFVVDPESTATYRSVRPGTTLGRFQVLELLGRGAFGEVYKARDSELDRFVAVKIPRADYFATSEEAQRFLREARSAAGLRHPGIVQVHEIAHEQDAPYIVSDYIEGLTLADLITGGRPAFRDSAELVAQLADALDYAHRQKVIHRDIKPSNILLGTGGGVSGRAGVGTALDTHFVPFLADFGLARRDEGEITVTLDGQVLGTPAYMSPEQAAGDHAQVDGRSDVYSLGVVLYELLSGELPFRGSRRMLLHQVLHDEPRAPRTLNDQIARDLETICLKAMAKEAARRYRTAAEFADDLRRFLRGDSITARRVGPIERTWRWCRRNPLPAGLIAAVAASLLIGTVVSTEFGRRAKEHRDEWQAAAEDAHRERIKADGLANKNAILAVESDRRRREVENSARDFRRMLSRNLFTQGESEIAARRFDSALQDYFRSYRLADGDSEWQNAVVDVAGSRPNRAIGAPLILKALTTAVVTFSVDGSKLLTVDDSHTARLWDAWNGAPLGTLEHKNADVRHASFSRNGSQILTVHADSVVRLWNAETYAPAEVRLQHDGVSNASFSPDGKSVITIGSDKKLRFWAATTGELLGPAIDHDADVSLASWSPDGTRVVTVIGDNTARIWDTTTKSLIGAPLRHGDKVNSAAFNPIGTLIVTSSNDNTAQLWSSTTGQPYGPPLRHGNWVSDASFSPDGKRLVSAGNDQTARLWDVSTGAAIGDPLRHPLGVNLASFSPDGNRIITECTDRTARLWDVATGSLIDEPFGEPARHGNAFWLGKIALLSPDGNRVVTAGPYSVRIWAVAPILPFMPATFGSEPFAPFSFSNDGRRIVAAADEVTAQVWDANTGTAVGSPLRHGSAITNAEFSPDDTRIATVGSNNAMQLWDSATMRPITMPLQHDDVVVGMAWSTDGTRLLTHCRNCTLSLWDPVSGKPIGAPSPRGDDWRQIFLGPNLTRIVTVSEDGSACVRGIGTGILTTVPLRVSGTLTQVQFSPDDRFIATATDERGQVWAAATGEPIGGLLPGWVLQPDREFTSDSTRFCTVMGQDGAYVMDLLTGELITGPLSNEPASRVLCVKSSPDSRRVATVYFNQTIRIWDAANGAGIGPQLLRDQQGIWQNHSVCFSPDGARLLSAGSSDEFGDGIKGLVRIFSVQTGAQLGPSIRPKRDKLIGWVTSASFTSDGSRIITYDEGGTSKLWDSTEPLARVVNAELWFEIITGHELDERADPKPLSEGEWLTRYQKFRESGDPWFDDVKVVHQRRALNAHRHAAHEAQAEGNWFASVFHLEWLARLQPDFPEWVDRLNLARSALADQDPIAVERGAELAPSSRDRVVPTEAK